MTEEQALTRARRGAAWLDKKLGTTSWRTKIKRSRLDMRSGVFSKSAEQGNYGRCGCILAQVDAMQHPDKLRGYYSQGKEDLGLDSDNSSWPTRLGFYTPEDAYPLLTQAWKQVLREERWRHVEEVEA